MTPGGPGRSAGRRAPARSYRLTRHGTATRERRTIKPGWTVGIDVGGTFTDAVAMHRDGRTLVAKVPSTPADPSVALLDAFEELGAAGVDPAGVALVFYGTTVATNAMLTGQSSRVVLLATTGFRDLMAFRDGTKPEVYDLRQPRPDEIAARDDRIDVTERMSSLGEVVTPLTDAEIDRIIGEVETRDPDAVAICFLFSYLNDAHEARLAARLRDALPGIPVTASSEIAREFREYPRTATTVVNAALRPIVGRHLEDAANGIAKLGVNAPFLVMQSNGGCVPADRAEREAHRLLLSGPTAGVAGTIALAQRHGIDRVIAFDMGGTSLDVCLIDGSVPPTVSTQVVHDHPILAPSVDIATAGAGGGSIASVDRAGRLHVGPESAGADPGPAAYGRGGVEPTLTDAHVVAGILGPTPLAGQLALDPDAAASAVTTVAGPLGLEPAEAAEGIIAVAVAHSVQALRRVSVERGLDPREFALVAFGGAGPLLAYRMLEEMRIASVIVPRHPGLFSAAGLMATSLRIDDAQTVLEPLEDPVVPQLVAWFREARERLIAQLADDGIPRSKIRVVASADCRYEGQGFELALTLPQVSARTVAGLGEALARRHTAMYGHADPYARTEVVALRLSAFGELTRHVPPSLPRGRAAPPEAAKTGERRALLQGLKRARRVPVFRRDLLRAGNVLHGPAIVDQMDSTVVVGPGQSAKVDQEANLWLRRSAR